MRTALAIQSVLAVTAGGLLLGVDSASAAPARDCLWAGGQHRPGTSIIAGGSTFHCHADGGPRWVRGAAVDRDSTVRNPGSDSHPASNFSPGALQPGTDLDGYCVGNQFVYGNRYVYEAVADGRGNVHWMSAGPIHTWRMDASTSPAVAPPAMRAQCMDGNRS